MGGSQFQLVEKRRQVPDLGAVDARIRPLLDRMLQPDPNDRPTMAEIESWSMGAPNRPPSQLIERTKATAVEHAELKPARPWFRYSAFAAGALLLIGTSAGAYYKYVWSIPIAPTSRPLAPLNEVALPPKPVPPALPKPMFRMTRRRPQPHRLRTVRIAKTSFVALFSTMTAATAFS